MPKAIVFPSGDQDSESKTIERITGKRLGEFVRERIAEPLGLPDLRIGLPIMQLIMGPDGLRFLELGINSFPEMDLETWAVEMIERDAHRRQWAAWFVEHPALLCPVWTQPAFEHDADIASVEATLAIFELMRPVLPANYLGLPAAVVPAGTADGLPVGVQVMGPAFSDLRCIGLADQIDQAIGLATPIDPR